MTGPRSPIYETRGKLEDVMALLGSCQERQRTILIHALQNTDFQVIFDEAAALAGELTRARRILSGKWCQIQALIEANNAEE